MRLQELLRNIETISCDSREEQANGLFVALSGHTFKGEDFIKDAIANGAVAVAKTDDSRQVGAGGNGKNDIAHLLTIVCPNR